jgi:hypothetical protein
MIDEFTREMSAQEREYLQERINSKPLVSLTDTLKWSVIWSVSLVGLIAFAALLFAFLAEVNELLASVAAGIAMLPGIICLYCLLAVISSYFRWRRDFHDFKRNRLPLLKQAFERGVVHTKRVTASSVIVIQEFEDEGSGYIFDIGDGKSLLLKGQWCFPFEESMPWPASEFEMVRTVDGVIWLGLFSRRDRLAPIKTIPIDECTMEFAWSDREEVLNGDPETVLRGVLKTAQQRLEGDK